MPSSNNVDGRKSLERVQQAQLSIGNGSSAREEIAMIVAPYANWEEHLSPGPLAIALLGNIMLTSALQDFSVEHNKPRDGFIYLKRPASFRACLAQIANSGWNAFNMAHKNMDQIRLYTLNIPQHFKNVVDTLAEGTPESIQNFLPIPLGAIEESSKQCLELAEEVEKEFYIVSQTLGELLEASTAAKGHYEQQLAEASATKKAAKQTYNLESEEKKRYEEQYKEFKRNITDSENSFKDAMNSVPSGWEIIGLSIVDAVNNNLKNVLNLGGIFSQKTGNNVTSKQQYTQQPTSEPAIPNATAYLQYESFKIQADALKSFLGDDDEVNRNKLAKEIKGVMFVEKQLNKIEATLQQCPHNINVPGKPMLEQMIHIGKTICENLKKIKNSINTKDDLESTTATLINELWVDAMAFYNEAKIALNASPTETKPPHLAYVPQPEASESVVKSVMENSRFKVEQASAQLAHVRDKYDESSKRISECNQRMMAVLHELNTAEMKEIDFEKIRKILKKGIAAMGELKEQWSKLVLFFQTMSNLIRVPLNNQVRGFVEYVKCQSNTMAVAGYTFEKHVRDAIYTHAFQACAIAHYVNMMGESYVEISDKYLMPNLSSLPKLLAFDFDEDEVEIEHVRRQLMSGLEKAQSAIDKCVRDHKKKFDSQINARMERIGSQMKTALSAIPLKSESMIREAINESSKKASECDPTPEPMEKIKNELFY